jgi:PAS domain S-box-containing protein
MTERTVELPAALQELQEQKAFVDELFELAPDAVVLTSFKEPRTLRVNREFTRMFGYTAEEAVGRRLGPLIIPDDAKRADLRANAELLAGKRIEFESVRRRKDGTRFHALVTAKQIREGVAYLIYRDISDRKLGLDALRESEARFRALTELSSDLYWRQDEEYRFTFISKGGIGLSGHELDSAIGKTRWELPGIVDPLSKSWEEHKAVMAAHQPFRDFEYRRVAPDGSVRYLSSSGAPIFDENGAFMGYHGVARDITERKRIEQELRQAQRLEAMGTLAGGIAHDFNNILGAILGYGEMALRDAPAGSRLRRDVESILIAGERGRALVDRVLTFSRSGVADRVAVHVEAVAREALALVAANLPAGVEIESRLEAGRAAMEGEPTQVHQVLMNLAMNAIQAMPLGGTLRVSLRLLSVDVSRIATIGSIGAGSYIVLRVEDTGSGIAPELLDRIFDPFFTTKEVNVGTGLGLSLVHGIVMELGGAIDVSSTLGSGSIFTVYLTHSGDAPPSDTDAEPVLPRGKGERVLIVDDEEPLIRLATRALEELGYVPVPFTSSDEALRAFRADPLEFDALITDERMPGLSGAALIREVRAIQRSIPIVLVSGYVGGLLAERAYNAGASEVLKKPISTRELATILARVLHAA